MYPNLIRKKGKSRSRNSKVHVVAARAALGAKEANLRQQLEIDKELLKLTQAKTQLEMNTKLAVLRAKEEVYLDNNSSSTSSQSTHSNLPAAGRKEIVQWVSQVENSLDKPKDTAKVPPETEKSTLNQKRQECDLNQNKQDSDLNPQAAAYTPVLKTQEVPDTTTLSLIQQGQIQQQQLLNAVQLPRAEFISYNGDPLQYWTFIRSFENSVENVMVDDNAKLMRLPQYCTAEAREVIQCCAVMEPRLGCGRAKVLLKSRFGDSSTIAGVWINKITNGSVLASRDKKGIRKLADQLKNCTESLKATQHISEINTQRVLVQIVERFPTLLKSTVDCLLAKIRLQHSCL